MQSYPSIANSLALVAVLQRGEYSKFLMLGHQQGTFLLYTKCQQKIKEQGCKA